MSASLVAIATAAFAGPEAPDPNAGPVIIQQSPEPAPTPPVVYAPPPPPTYQEAPPTTFEPVYAQPQQQYTQAPPEDLGPYMYLRDRPRLRLGGDGSVGFDSVGGTENLIGVATGRIGIQASNRHAVYVQAVVPFGLLGGASIIGIGGAVMYEVTANHWFHFAFGPSLDGVVANVCDGYTGPSCGGLSAYFGSDFRFSATVPSAPPATMIDHRTGVSFTLDLHPSLNVAGADFDRIVTGEFWATLGVGYEIF